MEEKKQIPFAENFDILYNYSALMKGKHSSQCRLHIMTSFQRVQYEKGARRTLQ